MSQSLGENYVLFICLKSLVVSLLSNHIQVYPASRVQGILSTYLAAIRMLSENWTLTNVSKFNIAIILLCMLFIFQFLK